MTSVKSFLTRKHEGTFDNSTKMPSMIRGQSTHVDEDEDDNVSWLQKK